MGSCAFTFSEFSVWKKTPETTTFVMSLKLISSGCNGDTLRGKQDSENAFGLVGKWWVWFVFCFE